MASFSIIIFKFPFYLDLSAQHSFRNGQNAIKKRLNWGREERKLINLYDMILSE